MLPKFAYISTEVDDQERRGNQRRTVFLSASHDGSPEARRAVLLDLSTTGFRLRGNIVPTLGESIWVDLPVAGRSEARVVWQREDHCGAEFTSPINQAALSAAILSSPHPNYPSSNSAPAPKLRLILAEWTIFAIASMALLLLLGVIALPT